MNPVYYIGTSLGGTILSVVIVAYYVFVLRRKLHKRYERKNFLAVIFSGIFGCVILTNAVLFYLGGWDITTRGAFIVTIMASLYGGLLSNIHRWLASGLCSLPYIVLSFLYNILPYQWQNRTMSEAVVFYLILLLISISVGFIVIIFEKKHLLPAQFSAT